MMSTGASTIWDMDARLLEMGAWMQLWVGNDVVNVVECTMWIIHGHLLVAAFEVIKTVTRQSIPAAEVNVQEHLEKNKWLLAEN